MNEVKMHWRLEECSNITKLLEVYENSTSVYLVLEFQGGGTLQYYITKNKVMDEVAARTTMA